MTITSCNLLERRGLRSPLPACFVLCEELGSAPRFMTYLQKETASIAIFV
jgi:hypothetical protein